LGTTDGGHFHCSEEGRPVLHLIEPTAFSVEIQPDRERVLLQPAGELDLSTASQLQDALDELRLTGWRHIVVDLRGLTFMDSTGLALILAADRDAERDGWTLEIIDGPAPIARLLELTGLDARFRRARV